MNLGRILVEHVEFGLKFGRTYEKVKENSRREFIIGLHADDTHMVKKDLGFSI